MVDMIGKKLGRPSIDLTGQRFGRYVVIEEAGRGADNGLMWRCRCDCGNVRIVNGTLLRNGRSKSCGCYAQELSSKRNSIDITGQKFSRLTVIKEAGRNKGGSIMWSCACDCGNEIVVRGNHLRSGAVQSCGCIQSECRLENLKLDTIGKVFGRLVVTGYVGRDKHGAHTWRCDCECGNETLVTRSSLRGGGTQSCGCYQRDCASKPMSMESRQKLSAAQQHIPYDEWEEFAKEQKYCPLFNAACRESNRAKYNYECFVCGLPQAQNITKTGKQKKLSVHHIDMDKNQGCDGHRWKLIPTCIRCHPGTHHEEIIARLLYLTNEV